MISRRLRRPPKTARRYCRSPMYYAAGGCTGRPADDQRRHPCGPDCHARRFVADRAVAGLPLSAVMRRGLSRRRRRRPSRSPPVAPGPLRLDQPAAAPDRVVRLERAPTGVFEAPLGRSVIGRGSNATLRIDSAEVSRVHALLDCSRGRVTIEDQGSVNGTGVNGVRHHGPSTCWPKATWCRLATIDLRVEFIRLGGRVMHRQLRVGCFVVLLAVAARLPARARRVRAPPLPAR